MASMHGRFETRGFGIEPGVKVDGRYYHRCKKTFFKNLKNVKKRKKRGENKNDVYKRLIKTLALICSTSCLDLMPNAVDAV